MINFTELEMILIACLPALTSIITSLSTLISVFKSLSQLKNNAEIKAERDKLVEQNKILAAECKKMRKQVALLIEKVTHIVYKDLTEVKNDEELQI